MDKFRIYYIAYMMWTPVGKLKLDIDNDACESLGNVSISTVEQFNLMMKVFKNKFKINI